MDVEEGILLHIMAMQNKEVVEVIVISVKEVIQLV